MILLIGGTSDTALLARGLADAGFKVLVSTATDLPLEIGNHRNISRRSGMLDSRGMERLAQRRDIQVIVDASHPYATSVRANAREAASALRIPYLSWIRPAALDHQDWIIVRESHQLAACAACSFGRPVLLTTGTRNLEPYVVEAKRAGVDLVVRVLPYSDSLERCRKSGIRKDRIITGRGPFSLEENLEVIRSFNIGVVVTKDSGVSGGMPEKIAAARIEGCQLVVVQRPAETDKERLSDVPQLVAAVRQWLEPDRRDEVSD